MPYRPTRITAFALTSPGLGPLLRARAATAGLRAGRCENDGRADVVRLDGPVAAVRSLRSAEDVCLDLGRIPIRATAAETAASILRADVVDGLRALNHLGAGHRVGVRVVARLTSERTFTRSGMRAAVERNLGGLATRDERAAELWVIQTTASTLQVGLRVEAWSRRVPREAERAGALRPAIAAAMVDLIGGGDRGRLLDPCCGTGTIAEEARAAGWFAVAGDLDPAALAATRRNTPAPLARLDARRLPYGTGSFGAVVTNLPFGREHVVQGVPVAWYRRVLAESLRVAPLAVVLMPPTAPFRQALGRLKVALTARHDVLVQGRPATIWVITRP